MRTFNLRVRFTGVCAFVPDKPFKEKPQQVMVVIPDGESRSRGVDSKGLNRHRAFVRFDLRNVVGMPKVPRSTQGIWEMKQQTRLTLCLHDGPSDLTIGDVTRLADMGAIVDDYTIDPDATSSTPPETVLAQFLIDRGKLYTGFHDQDWAFTKNLCHKNVVVTEMSNEVILDVEKVTHVSLKAQPLSGDGEETLELRARAGGRVTITVANLCDTNPLEWTVRSSVAKADQDFRWFFELLSEQDRTDLGDIVSGLYLPHPWPIDRPNGKGMDCFPTSFQPPASGSGARARGQRASSRRRGPAAQGEPNAPSAAAK